MAIPRSVPDFRVVPKMFTNALYHQFLISVLESLEKGYLEAESCSHKAKIL